MFSFNIDMFQDGYTHFLLFIMTNSVILALQLTHTGCPLIMFPLCFSKLKVVSKSLFISDAHTIQDFVSR